MQERWLQQDIQEWSRTQNASGFVWEKCKLSLMIINLPLVLNLQLFPKEADTCVTCEICGKVLKKGSMGYHSMTHSTKVVKETHTDVNNVKEAVTIANSRKRASAIRYIK